MNIKYNVYRTIGDIRRTKYHLYMYMYTVYVNEMYVYVDGGKKQKMRGKYLIKCE